MAVYGAWLAHLCFRCMRPRPFCSCAAERLDSAARPLR